MDLRAVEEHIVDVIDHCDGAVAGACAVAAAISRAFVPGCSLYDMVQAAFYGAQQGEELARQRTDIWDYVGPSVVRRLRMAVRLAVNADQDAMDEIRDLIGSGPAISESVPAAFALLIARRGDVRMAMEDAVNIGDETAAIACLVGQLGGALRGADVFAQEERTLLDEANQFDLTAFAEGFLR